MPPLAIMRDQGTRQIANVGQSEIEPLGPGRRDDVRRITGEEEATEEHLVACHMIAEANRLPLLVLILGIAEWGADRRSTLGLDPNGHAGSANVMPLTSVAKTSQAWAARVEDRTELPAELRGAIAHIDRERTQALVAVKVAG